MTIDALLEFPELGSGTATPETIAPVFRHMVIQQPATPPICRILLEARWDDDSTADGEITQTLSWVTTLDAQPSPEEKHPFSAADRGLIQLVYAPATREPGHPDSRNYGRTRFPTIAGG